MHTVDVSAARLTRPVAFNVASRTPGKKARHLYSPNIATLYKPRPCVSSFCWPRGHVRAVFLVLAKHFEDVFVGEQMVRDCDRKRPRVHRRIVERHLDVEMTEIRTTESLDDMELITVRMCRVEPCFVVESGALDDEGVALPAAN